MIYAFAYAARERPKIIRFFVIELLTFFRGVHLTRCAFTKTFLISNFHKFSTRLLSSVRTPAVEWTLFDETPPNKVFLFVYFNVFKQKLSCNFKAKVILSRLPISDVATQWLADQ